MMKITLKNFLDDDQGRRFADVVNDPAVDWPRLIDWLNQPERQARLEMAEVHFDKPALAGVLRELEGEQFVQDYFDTRSLETTQRVKQALGVLAKLHMEALGWSTTGRKGPLGRRDPGRKASGPHNKPTSFSRYVLSAERYTR